MSGPGSLTGCLQLSVVGGWGEGSKVLKLYIFCTVLYQTDSMNSLFCNCNISMVWLTFKSEVLRVTGLSSSVWWQEGPLQWACWKASWLTTVVARLTVYYAILPTVFRSTTHRTRPALLWWLRWHRPRLSVVNMILKGAFPRDVCTHTHTHRQSRWDDICDVLWLHFVRSLTLLTKS